MDIAFEWDGQTPTALLHVEGASIEGGSPVDVQCVFDVLNDMRDEIRWLRKQIKEFQSAADRVNKVLETCDLASRVRSDR